MPSPLSFQSTQDFRKKLIVRNLKPYKVEGFYNSNGVRPSSEVVLRDEGVFDSPDDIIGTDLFSQILYPLNAYGPSGGYKPVPSVGGLNNTKSNLGEYNYQDATLPESSFPYQEQIPTKNKYSSDQRLLFETDYIQLKPEFETYWSPISFVPSTYSPANILLSDDPQGSDGLLSQDSFIASLSAQFLRKLLKDRAGVETAKQTFGAQTLSETLGNPFIVQNTLSNTNQTNDKSWTITRPENQVDANAIFVQKLQGTYIPASPIPGDYFDEDMNQKRPTGIQQIFSAFADGDTLSSAVRAIIGTQRNPSETFLVNTGFGQKSQLFFNLDYNQYKPAYSRGLLNDIANAASNVLTDLFNGPEGAPGGYYVGNQTNEPAVIDSPPGERPVLYQGMESEAIVYGPDRLAREYENPSDSPNAAVRIASAGFSLTDGGGLDGGLVWASPKYKNAGFYATPGGGQGSADPEYNQVSGQIERDLSTNKNFKNGSILDFTQRLVNSTPNGAKRLSHVGNAINNLSKVFNDGYKEITKGSRVIKYEGSNGQYKGVEYGRLFTKDTPYFTFADLQKTQGITRNNRGFVNSVLDNTFNLNIAPLNGKGSTNIKEGPQGQYAQKYMFSIENLAWRTSTKPGFTVLDLPFCERGPNGGRIMWFPPYGLKFSENLTPNFQDNEFLGRPEPILTYRNTKRTGTLSWKMIVDYPSILDVIVQKELGKESNRLRLNEIVDSFMAGLLKFDIYELARKFSTIPTNELVAYQNLLANSNVNANQVTEVGNNVKQTNTGGKGDSGVATASQGDDKSSSSSQNNLPKLSEFNNVSFFFGATNPPGSIPPVTTYSLPTYPTEPENVNTFNDSVVKYNFDTLTNNLITELKKTFESNPKASVKISFNATSELNVGTDGMKAIAVNRQKSVEEYIKSQFNGTTFVSNNQLTFSNADDIEVVGSITPQGKPQGQTEGGSSTFKPSTYQCDSQETINVLACRAVTITKIEVTNDPQTDSTASSNENTETNNNVNPTPVSPVSRNTLEKVRQGLSKRLVRELLSECSYFEVIKESNPFIYDTIRDKVKYFNPAFHSTTPEGLNARLTFLNQCTRPGDTIPTIGTDGKPKNNNARNTAFGAPPVLVLRVGDFYNTKIIPNSIQITYDEILDINPEGIGVQPMIANVTLGFTFVGGSGLANAVDTLQNALTFNYYANTEIYDERAEATEDTSERDNKLLKQLLADQAQSTKPNNQKQNEGGQTIGVKTGTDQSGEMSYTKFMDSNLALSQAYINSLLNKSEEIINNYNHGILSIVSTDRSFNKGKTRQFTQQQDLQIYGKSNAYQKSIDTFFNKLKQGVQSENLDYLKEMKKQSTKFKPKVINDVRDKILSYLDSVKGSLLSNLTTALNEVTQSQVDLVRNLAKTDFVDSSNDGYIDSKSSPIIYNISASTNALQELQQDYNELTKGLNNFYNSYEEAVLSLKLNDYPIPTASNTVIKTETDQLFFIFMSNVILDTNKRNEFVQKIVEGNSTEENSSGVNLLSFSNTYWDNVSNVYNGFKTNRTDTLKDVQSNTNYSKFEPYTPGKERKFTYTLNSGATDDQKTRLTNLYKDGNSNTNNTTFNGKNTFN